MGFPRLLVWTAWAALAGLLAQRLVQDGREPLHCDTTYLWQGYEEELAGEGGAYRLVRFADKDAKRAAAYAQLQDRHVVPVLFVHGHLGSHQQMRSAASETGRELARRLEGDAAWPFWMQWFATDFSAEASALDGGLLERQASFVLQCIQHLQRAHNASNEASGLRRPFRLVVVAYSMGGSVAQAALRRLAADPSFDLGQVVAFVTLGAPTHMPQLMPHTPLRSLVSIGSDASTATRAAAAAAVAAAAVPRVNIAAGAGDHLLPDTLGAARTPLPLAPGEEPGLSLLMRDMPAVWTTCSHKGIVSCNQLVRQLVPALVDAAAASLRDADSTVRQQAAIQRLLQERLAPNLAAALMMADTVSGGDAGEEEAYAVAAAAAGGEEDSCLVEAVVEAVVGGRPPQVVNAPMMRGGVQPNLPLKLVWDADELADNGSAGLLLLVTAAPPCSHLAVTAALRDGGGSVQLSRAAAALPPLLAELQPRWVPRPWDDVVAGVEWQHNATRLLYVPFQRPDGRHVSTVAATVLGSAGQGTTLLAQVLDSHPSLQALQLLAPGGGEAELPGAHSALTALRLPAYAWPRAAHACAAGGLGAACLPALLLGTAPPLSLRVRQGECDDGGPMGARLLLPALLAVDTGAAPADSVRAAGAGEVAADGWVVRLWEGVGPLEQLFLVTDPACSYSLRLEWDLGGWLGLSLRQLLFVVPTLCIAACQAWLSPLHGATTRVALVVAVAAAWGSLNPAALRAATGGLHPWLRLSVAEALAALLLAAGTARLLASLQSAGLSLLRWVVPASAARRTGLLSWLGLTAVAAGSLVHPALAAYCGCVCLALRLAAASKQAGAGGKGGKAAAGFDRRALSWLLFYGQLAALPSAGLYSWLASGMRHEVEWSDDAVLVTALALHACLLRCGSGGGKGGSEWRRLARAAVHEVAACAAAASSLWGHPAVVLYAACASAVAEVLLA